mmetsp:Transcript_15351/g.31688  ORF Transcript_15351/g.31688 Transcript_15351/m.31688 type:complete len:372 (+) Transcript_15351:589-1704(+)
MQVEGTGQGDTAHQNIGKQENSHTTQDGVRNRGDNSSNLTKDTQENEPASAGVSGTSAGTLGQGNDTIVLGKGGVGHGGEETRQQTTHGIRCQTTLERFVVFFCFSVEHGHFVDGRNISDRFDSGDQVGNQEGDQGWTIESQGEGFNPKEGDGISILDSLRVDVRGTVVVGDTSDKVSKQESNDNVTVLHEDGTEQFNNDQHAHDGNSQSNEFSGTVSQHDFSVGTGGSGDGAEASDIIQLRMFLPNHVGTNDTTSPVLHSGSGQSHTNQNDSDRSDDGRKNFFDPRQGHDREEKFQQTGNHTGTQHASVGIFREDSVGFHLSNSNFENGQKGKGSSHDGQDTGSQVQGSTKNRLGEGDGQLGNLHHGANS